MNTISLKDREKILAKVSHLVATKHFNPSLNGVNWPDLVESHRAQILQADTIEHLETEIHKLVSELKTSHTGFFHRSLRKIPARYAINATFQRCSVNGMARWMFEDVHEGGAAYAAGFRPGDILLAIDGKEILPPDHPCSEWEGRQRSRLRNSPESARRYPWECPSRSQGSTPSISRVPWPGQDRNPTLVFSRSRCFPVWWA